MSYLNALRLHFSGRFRANVSTVNNQSPYFDNLYFRPEFQTIGPGLFNPEGDASFRLIGCGVRSAFTSQGPVGGDDPVLGCAIADADDRVPAKLVDLDPLQQLVSEIWGLEVRIRDAAGATLLRGEYRPAAFTDIWLRTANGAGGDVAACAAYHSVLENLEWGDVSGSAFLSALRDEATASGLLSMRFNVDGMDADFQSPEFMTGRVVGTIGPQAPDDPCHLVVGRYFIAQNTPGNDGFFLPVGKLNFIPAVVDEPGAMVYLDLGNALPTDATGGSVSDLGDIELAAYDPDQPAAATPIATIAAQGVQGYAADPGWYERTAGVVALPLTAAQLALIASRPMRLSGDAGLKIAEWPNAAYVRADRFVFRMAAGDRSIVDMVAMQYGRPLAGASLALRFDPSGLQQYLQNQPVADPPGAVAFPTDATTDAHGRASVTVSASDPGTPRWLAPGRFGLDGQVYGIRPAFADPAMEMGDANPSDFVSFLLWSDFVSADPVTWAEVRPVFQQYANLYPAMLRFLNMADPDELKANARLLMMAFNLDIRNPNAMPVTRDLSPAKRKAILAWLQNPIGAPGGGAPIALATAPSEIAVEAPPRTVGKEAALEHRLGVRGQQRGEGK